jgi:hypothetical protein
MPEPLKNCEYFLAYYAPSALRGTRVAIGVMLFEGNGRPVGQKFTGDWRTVRCLDPNADLELLGTIATHFKEIAGGERADPERTESGAGFLEHLRSLQQDFAGSLQISPARGVQTDNPEQELERLFAQHIAPRPASVRRPTVRQGSRPWVREQLADALKRHGLWERLQRDVSVEQFTAPGDAFRIDFSYQPNGVVHYVHALSLERDWTQAKLLGYTYWRMREKAESVVTAVVGDADPALATVRSCRQILREARIAVEPLSRLDAFLEGVRRELG